MIRRIAWVGPWNARSAIAQFGAMVVERLAGGGVEVEIVRSEVGADAAEPSLAAPGAILWAGEVDPWQLWRDHDAVLINIGDHYGFHGGALSLYGEVPAVAILHDAYVVNLLRGAGGDTLARAATALHGVQPVVTDLPPDADAASRPMTEWFAAGAAGAIVHAEHYAPRVRAACPGPVCVLPLAYRAPDLAPPRATSDVLCVATIGRLGPNKRADEVIRGIAAVRGGAGRIRYRLIGAAEPAERARLEALAGELGVEVSFAGEVSDAALAEEFAAIDVVACLRHPALEGASASLIVGMLSARPVLVSRQGVYAEVPDDLVLSCAPGAEAADVARHLTAILGDRQPALRMAARARTHAGATHDPARYAEGLLDFIPQAMLGAAAIGTGRSLGARMAAFGVGPDDPAVGRLGAALTDLLGGTGVRDGASLAQ